MIKWAKKQGFASFEVEGIKIVFGEPSRSSPPPAQKTDPIPVTEDPTAKMPSDTDMMMWSTPSFDITMETRKDDELVRIM